MNLLVVAAPLDVFVPARCEKKFGAEKRARKNQRGVTGISARAGRPPLPRRGEEVSHQPNSAAFAAERY
jgi:hypothetical protein